MAKLAGFSDPKLKMIRQGFRHNPDPFATASIPFAIDVDDPTYDESWSDTLTLYHNPFAKIPLDPDLFPDISQVFFDPKGKMVTYVTKPNEVVNSMTVTIIGK